MGPRTPGDGERGWLVEIHPMDDIVQWNEAGDDTVAFTQNPWVRRVDDRNEPDPEKWLPGDPFGKVQDSWRPPPVGNYNFGVHLCLSLAGHHESTPLRSKVSLP